MDTPYCSRASQIADGRSGTAADASGRGSAEHVDEGRYRVAFRRSELGIRSAAPGGRTRLRGPAPVRPEPQDDRHSHINEAAEGAGGVKGGSGRHTRTTLARHDPAQSLTIRKSPEGRVPSSLTRVTYDSYFVLCTVVRHTCGVVRELPPLFIATALSPRQLRQLLLLFWEGQWG